jgi:hypothetical protein
LAFALRNQRKKECARANVNAKFQRRSQSIWEPAFQPVSNAGSINHCRSSAYRHQELGVIRQILDEKLTGWPAVVRIVTDDLFCIATRNVEETIITEGHSSKAIKTTGPWRDKNARRILAKIMSQN